jgi:hypothetical protein
MKKTMFLLFFLLIAIAGYHFFVQKMDVGMRRLYYEKILKPRVKPAPVIRYHDKLTLGIYRPELPMNFAVFFMMQDSLRARFNIISLYQSWGMGSDYDFNEEIMKEIARHGYTPMLTWEPWLSAFPEYKNQLVYRSLRKIADGDFDHYIIRYARSAVYFAHPMYLRFAHEMTNPWYGWAAKYNNKPKDYRDAWNHVVHIFRMEGAGNVAFVWTPYSVADTAFYPGDSSVDAIGIDVFNYGTSQPGGIWKDFYSVCKPMYDAYKKIHKPFILAEVGTTTAGGSRKDWYKEMFHELAIGTFPNIASVVFFDNPSGRSPDGLYVDLRLSADSSVYAAIKDNVQLLVNTK